MSGDVEIYYEGERIDTVRALEIQEIQAQQTRRSAEINCHVELPARRMGKGWALAMIVLGAGCGFDHLAARSLKNAGAPRSPKHWVERKDWTQRQKRRRRK